MSFNIITRGLNAVGKVITRGYGRLTLVSVSVSGIKVRFCSIFTESGICQKLFTDPYTCQKLFTETYICQKVDTQ